MPYRDDSSDWLFFAESDLRTARVMFGEGVYHMTCFHAQQAVEKCLKAVLRHHQKMVPKTHSLAKLIHEVSPLGAPDIANDDVLFVDQFYSPTRYPDTLPGSLPDGLPTKEDAAKAVDIAERIVAATKKLISSNAHP
ncbi:HEPN domain-containing protein [Candidatus Gottesmanbacteria bacterium]|nr:HEPN domain-containing protein [Candidatus Gottesmanbacteria bacterium]